MSTLHAPTIVVLTAQDVEYVAVRALLSNPQVKRHPAGTIFEKGQIPNGNGSIILAQAGMGNQAAAIVTERAIAAFAPHALLFVGIAGALHDHLQLGDVVVATKIYGYHGGKEEGKGLLARPQAWETSYALTQLAQHVSRQNRWTALVQPSPERSPRVHFEPIAAGEVVLNSRDTALATQLHTTYNDAAAIEMESAGVAKAGHLNDDLPVLTIRSISNWADGHKQSADDAGGQRAAATHAAAFALTLAASISGKRMNGVSDGKDARVPAYLGCVLDENGAAAGTCFQVAPGILVTAWQLLHNIGAGTPDSAVQVGTFSSGTPPRRAVVRRVDPERDLAILSANEPLPGTVPALSPTDAVRLQTPIAIGGVKLIDDLRIGYGFQDPSGRWDGSTAKNHEAPLGRLTSKAVAHGAGGGPVRRIVDDVVIGVVSARYNSAGDWPRDTVWVARVEDVLPLLDGIADVEVTGQPKVRAVRPRTVIVTLTVTIMLAVLATIGLQKFVLSSGDSATELAALISVDPVQAMQRQDGDPNYVLPSRLEMSTEQLDQFNNEVVPHSERYSAWITEHGAVPLGFGWTKVTVRNNATETVRITDLKVLKECTPALNGTLFSEYTQGGPSGTIPLGFDLDAQKPIVKEMANTPGKGAHPVGKNYFTLNSIDIDPGGVQELTIAALSDRLSCSFRLQLVISTSAGTVTRDVDNNGKPFVVSAPASGNTQNNAPVGYQARYVQGADQKFQKVTSR
ncbi:phosphorylase family protein [Amycolatopsis sp. TRM77291]